MVSHTNAETNALVHEKMIKGLKQLDNKRCFDGKSKSFCYKHNGRCKVDDVPELVHFGESGWGSCRGFRLVAGGLVCVHWSRQGDMSGFAGHSAKACMVFVEERRFRREPFWVMECTFSQELVDYIACRLDHDYDIDWLVIGPDDLGDPVKRDRLWVTGVLRTFASRTRPMSDLKPALSREVVAGPSIYYPLNEDKVQKFVDNRARAKRMVSIGGAKFAFKETLTPCELVRLDEYLEIRDQMREAGKIGADGDFICDLGHNPGPMTKVSYKYMSCMTRNHVRYNDKLERALFGPESLATQGVATDTVLEEAMSNGTWNMACRSGVAFQPGLNKLSEHAQRELAGNGMHLRVATAVLAWLLSHAAPSTKLKLDRATLKKFKDAGIPPTKQASVAPRGPRDDFSVGCKMRLGARGGDESQEVIE